MGMTTDPTDPGIPQGTYFKDDLDGGRLMTVASEPYTGPKSHEEARAIHEGFITGLTAYACTIGHSTLKSENQTLRELMDKHGWETIEAYEKLAATESPAETIKSQAKTIKELRGELAKRMAWRLNTALQDAVAALKEIAEFQAAPDSMGPYEQIAVFCKNRARAALASTQDPLGDVVSGQGALGRKCSKCGAAMVHYRLKGYVCSNPGCPGPYGGGPS